MKKGEVILTDKNRQFNYGLDMGACSFPGNEYVENGVSCDISSRRSDFSCVDKYPLAMAYVPMQEFVALYDCETGFDKGTIFSALDFPFTAYCK